ncbi:MAG: HYR domain-containing protein [Saprospiraceae bacterium]|nr:HYR domain-containing protein [Saprospiraceae bacterium]MCF8251892.1 HYR domain-containing protein [Saprospiraceae bacterium]MCF8281615.1 HYR domain-containing protein [Bacteroidales bacterium]MCF8313592.1 HYR domain-containing protein [Saprospiraceae bacterium]MCF8442276.1 HYR domain-containing protein [Saprospiraceae bacterium]
MKSKLKSVYVFFFVLLAAYFQLSYSTDPPNGYTGAPPTNNTCSNCHSGGTGTGMVTIIGLPSTVAPNTVYPLTITITRTNNAPQAAGFQLVAQQIGNNSNAGTLTNPGPNSTVQLDGGKYYFEQTSPQGFTNDMVSFTVNWTAPTSSNGDIRLYTAANLVNLNGNNSGDVVVTSTATTTLVGGGGPITVSVSGTNVNCFGGNNGSATAMASGGGGPPYTFMWSNGGSGATINNLTAGTYTVSVTNGVGGSGTGSVMITQPTQLSVSIVNQNNITCINPIGSATALANGGTPSYTYTWSNGQSGPTANLNAGTHTVSVTDGNACIATTTVNINSNTTPPAAEAGPPAVITCTTPNPMLNGAGSSTGGNFSYLWTTISGIIISGATTLTPTVGGAGSYTLTVTNSTNGCTASDLTTVSVNNSPPTSNAGSDGLLNCTTTSLILNGNSSSQGGNFTYLWTTANGNIVSGETTLMPSVDEPGSYCLKVTNTLNGCTATDCASVTENVTPPLANAGSASPLTCTTSEVTLNGSASSQGSNFSYLWTTTSGNIVSGATSLMPVVNVAAAYTLIVTNSNNGCTASSSVTVGSNTTPPTASAGPDRALNCNNTSVVLNGSGSSQGPNFSYNWTGPGIQSGENTPNPTVNAAGSYAILVTNTNNGCTMTDTAIVTQTSALIAAITASQNVACNGANTGSATASASGGTGPYAYAWSNNANTPQITNIAAGTYTVSITDADDCVDTASVVITQPPVLNPNASATGETSVGENDGTATASPSGGVPGYSYAWSNGATTQTITGLTPGNYMVSVTDTNNCTASQTVTVASFSCAGVGVNLAAINPSCNGGSDGSATATVSGSMGPYEFTWPNGDTTSSIVNLTAGNYTVSILDANGCDVTGNVSLVSPTAINLTVQQTNVACHGDSTGMATVNASGGTPGYEYAWPNGGGGASQNGLPAGTYTVSVSDANDCLATIQVVISQPPILTGTLSASGESGVGANDGTASVAVSGGVAPYTYLWNNNATTSAITGLAPGSYCVSAMDANGCTFTGCETVIAFGCTGQTLTFSSENVLCAGADDGTAQVTATGFADPLTFAWSNGENGSSVGNLTAGDYTVSVTDANGCQSSESIEITEPVLLSVEILTQNNLECAGGNDGLLSVGGIGGTPGYAFSWSNGETTPTISDLTAGVYEVNVSDDNDCAASMSYEIMVLPDTEAPMAMAMDISVGLNLSGTVSISPAMVDGGSSDNCGIASMAIDVMDFGCDQVGENTVMLTVTDAAGNTATATATVVVLDETAPVIVCPQNMTVDNGSCAPIVDYILPTATDNCGNPTPMLVTGPETGTTFPSGATTVTWAADDGNGNSATCSFTVTVIGNFSVGTSFAMPACQGDSNGTATATPIGGTPPYNYAWSDPTNQTTQTATGLPSGTYNVSVMDSQGCQAVETVQVTEPTTVSIEVDAMQNASGGPSGFIEVTVSGGAGNYSYEWLLNGVFYSNLEDINGLGAGEYLLIATDQNGCAQSLTVAIELLDASEELTLERRITLAPNPSTGRVFVDFDLGQELPATLQVFDLSGKAILPFQTVFVSSKSIELDLGGAAPGVYFLRIIVDETVVIKRMVVGR